LPTLISWPHVQGQAPDGDNSASAVISAALALARPDMPSDAEGLEVAISAAGGRRLILRPRGQVTDVSISAITSSLPLVLPLVPLHSAAASSPRTPFPSAKCVSLSSSNVILFTTARASDR
jgi:hypothetical protein